MPASPLRRQALAAGGPAARRVAAASATRARKGSGARAAAGTRGTASAHAPDGRTLVAAASTRGHALAMRRWWWLVGTGAGCVVVQPGPTPPTPAPAPAASGSAAASQARPPLEVAGGWGKFRPPLRPAIKASSEYPGWPALNAVDGNSETSWFSARNDTASRGVKPWLELTLDRTVVVRGVRVMGNRDPRFPSNFSVLAARIELLDDRGNTLFSQTKEGQPPRFDLEFKPPAPVASVRIVSLIVERDQGDLNSYGDTAVGEVLIDEALDEAK